MKEREKFTTVSELPSESRGSRERRHKVRLHGPFAARARGVNDCGEAFEVETHLENISGGGLYLRVPQKVAPGAVLFILTRFTAAPPDEVLAPTICIRGTVLRAEPQPDSTCGVALAITQHRFL